MTRLSLFDQLFYKAEMAGLPPLYMAGVMIMDPTQSEHKIMPNIVAAHLAARMERIPLMRKKVVQDALRIGSVRLVDDPAFNVRNHITTSVLPKPGGYKEFTEHLATFSERPLDLSIPPWHYEVIDGLEGGRMALAIHLHHAVMDGLGAQDALSSIYDAKSMKPEKPKKQKWRGADQSAPSALLSSALMENMERVFIKAPKYFLESGLPLAKSLAAALSKQLNLEETPKSDAIPLPEVKKTSLNTGVPSSKRVVSYVELPILDALAMRKHFECSINDLALVLNSAALDYYFEKIHEKVDFDLVAIMPMNARKEGETGPGNVLTIARVNLHNTIPNLALRLKAIAADTARIKAQHRSKKPATGPSIDGRALMELFSPLVVDSLLYAAAALKLTTRVVVANLGITNVPGSPVPLYIAGAPVVSGVPMAPVIGGVLGMTITVSSTDKYLLFGYHGDGASVKEKDWFVEGARKAFDNLKQAAAPKSSTRSERKRAPVQPSRRRAKPKRTAAAK